MNYLVSTGVSKWLFKCIFFIIMQTGNSLVLIFMADNTQGKAEFCLFGRKLCWLFLVQVGKCWWKKLGNHEKKQEGVGRCSLTR